MIKSPIIETSRLLLSEFDEERDSEVFYNLNKDPIVMQYTGDKAFNNIADAKEFIKNYSDYKKNGFGRWTIVLKENKIPIGWCGLKKHSSGMVDLGFRILRDYWNQGYATEASNACIKFGFDSLLLTEIIGRTASENTASRKVLGKTGMEFWKKAPCKGIENSIYYKITR